MPSFHRMSLGLTLVAGLALSLCGQVAVAADVPISAVTAEIDPDFTAVYYARYPANSLLIGNDGSAATGGVRAWNLLDGAQPMRQVFQVIPGRPGVVGVLYDIADRDFVVSIAAPDSVIRLFNVDGFREVPSAQKKMLGHWSALCPWRSPRSGWQYFYLFGKKRAVQFVMRETDDAPEIVEVQTFDIPVEPESCTISKNGKVYLAAEEDKTIYTFQAEESTAAPTISVLGEAEDDVSGLAMYFGSESEYLFVAQTDVLAVYSPSFELLGSVKFTGPEDLEIAALSIYQRSSTRYPSGVLAYALESDDGEMFGVSSLAPLFETLDLDPNTTYTPRSGRSSGGPRKNGFELRDGSLACFAGWKGRYCSEVTCPKSCSGHGRCVGPNQCRCDASWAGPDCSFALVRPKYETDPNGEDGDDPAIWISPVSPGASRIITTTKSEEGAGLAVFDLTGKMLQTVSAGEPNNVDVIYGFKAGNRTVDLAFAACRDDNTLCLFEMTSEGQLVSIDGGKQPTPEEYEVYGSCVYRSKTTGNQYLFVNDQTGQYLQFEPTSASNGTLSTALVRSFTGGSGGQVEGCVTDEAAGFIFLGEEGLGFWRYDAEPNGSNEGTLIASAGDGTLFADVEGITFVPGKTADKGLILVSCQGVSAYSIFRRAPPHAHVGLFTIGRSTDGAIDAVSNTDGITAVGTRLSDVFPHELLVTHDDANELAAGGTAEMASFKLVSLADVLGRLGVLDEVDSAWNPRA